MSGGNVMSRGAGTVDSSMSWSALSEAAAKLITPLTSMLLARILAPEQFGVVAVCNMVVGFADIITDAGFGKYLIQRNFSSEDELKAYANVGFWSNFALSSIILLIIIFFRKPFAVALGSEGYSAPLSLACFQLIMTALSSIQTSLFRRSFDFKTLFRARLLTALTPLIISVPLALLTRTYWAILIGNLASAALNALFLTAWSSWRPTFTYSVHMLKEMFDYSFWSLCEGLANWTIFWFDTFLVTRCCSDYYLGLYKNSTSMVMSIMGMISASVSPVLLSSLSRVKDNASVFRKLFLSLQRVVLYVAMPMGVGLACYSRTATLVLFGSQWLEADFIVRCWALMMTCSIVFYSFPAELYKSTGTPRLLFHFQLYYLAFVIPVSAVAIRFGFRFFVIVRCVCVFEQVLVSIWMVRRIYGFETMSMIRNLIRPTAASMGIVLTYLLFYDNSLSVFSSLATMLLSGLTYCAIVRVFFWRDVMTSLDSVHAVRVRA